MSAATGNGVTTLSVRLPDAVLDKIRALIGLHGETATSFVERSVGQLVEEVKSGNLDVRRPLKAWWDKSHRTMWTVRIPTALKKESEALKHRIASSMTNWILLAAIRELENWDE
jgi:hypothetical protein